MPTTAAAFHVFSTIGDDRIKQYKKRQLHVKSASGCLACRAKRVKCDEQRPYCVRCLRNSRECIYDPVGKAITRLPASELTDCTSKDVGIPLKYILEHCHAHWDDILGIEDRQRIMDVASSSPVLTKTLIALSASHLRRICPTRQHRIAEHHHQSTALRDCRQLMTIPADALGQAGVNALSLSALLLNMLAFALEEAEDEFDMHRSWVFSEYENRLGWIILQEGLRHLLRSAGGWHVQPTIDFLTQTFVGGPDEIPRTWITSEIADIPDKWREFFGIDDTVVNGFRQSISAASRGGIFYPAVNALLKMPRPKVGVKVFHFFPFLLKVNSNLRAFLYARDDKAIWLMGYWFALMSHCAELWWFHARVRRDYLAVRLWLRQACVTEREGREGELWRDMMEELDTAAHAVPVDVYVPSNELRAVLLTCPD